MWTDIKEKDQSKYEKAHDRDTDLVTTLHQVMTDLREEKDQSLYHVWGINPKEFEWCQIKVRGAGDEVWLELSVNQHFGGRRMLIPPAELDRFVAETEKVLRKFEKAFRECFKEKTGKALRLTRAKTVANREKVALNDLYRFYAIKVAKVRTDLKPNEWPENSKERKEKEME